MNIFSYFFSSKEEKLIKIRAIFVCDDLELPEDLKTTFIKSVNKNISMHIEKFKTDNTKVDGWLNIHIANLISRRLCLGDCNVYRGVLSMEGQMLMEIFLHAMKNAVKYGVITQKECDESIQDIKRAISEVG